MRTGEAAGKETCTGSLIVANDPQRNWERLWSGEGGKGMTGIAIFEDQELK